MIEIITKTAIENGFIWYIKNLAKNVVDKDIITSIHEQYVDIHHIYPMEIKNVMSQQTIVRKNRKIKTKQNRI